MNSHEVLQQLIALLEDNGVEVRSEPLGGSGGGLCKIKDKNIFFLDTQAPTAESANQSAEAVGRLVDIESIYLKPEIRQYIEDCIKTERQ
ncbi:MAG: hypothetical protein WC374_01170 [Phycisphaerae bacterium]|jgi:hypothetical protein